ACCGWAALKSSRAHCKKASAQLWGGTAGVLIFLGINKQLSLQTLMIDIGRRVAVVGGWFEYRRVVQAIFCVAFLLTVLGFLIFFAAATKWFIKENPLAFIGISVLVFFVILRASTINHSDQLLGINLMDKAWAWILEVCGSALIAAAAVMDANRHRAPS
ncbi:MAG TPA: hypothetical protein VFC44_22115, partial [Candidatus Saccharimonadales bacterium]|nr:hypothetical protein [Candidatus Saccharimonadales bacterium]